MKIMKKIFYIIAISILLTACTSNIEKSKEFYKQGEEKNRISNFKGAIEAFSKAIELDSNFTKAYFQRGNSYFNLRKAEEALKDYNKAIELDSNFADAYFNRGNIKAYKYGKYEACEDWLKAEELGKENMYEKTKFCK
jgi:tetratricopeptide (TPR) repeat protein